MLIALISASLSLSSFSFLLDFRRFKSRALRLCSVGTLVTASSSPLVALPFCNSPLFPGKEAALLGIGGTGCCRWISFGIAMLSLRPGEKLYVRRSGSRTNFFPSRECWRCLSLPLRVLPNRDSPGCGPILLWEPARCIIGSVADLLIA